MEFVVDVKTLLVTLVLGNLFTVILLAAYHVRREWSQWTLMFVLAKTAQFAAWGMLALRGIAPELVTVFLANILLYIGAGLEGCSVLLLIGKCSRRVVRNYIAMVVGSILAFLAVFLFRNEEPLRIALISLVVAVLIVYPAYRLTLDQDSSPMRRRWGTRYGLVILALLLRTYHAFVTLAIARVFDDSIFNSLTFIALYVHMIVVSQGFILTAKEKADKQLMESATVDSLTGCLNRRAFVDEADKYLSLLWRTAAPVTFLMIDIDNFKSINDTFGHVAGDQVLRGVADRIHARLRSHDLFGRFGGDEFAILLPNAGEESSDEVVRRLQEYVEGTVIEEENRIRVTLSAGITTRIPTAETRMDDLYRLADEALYQVKSKGRHGVIRKNN